MSWLDGLTKNWAELAEDNPDPRLRPLIVPADPADAVRGAAAVVATHPRWRIVSADPRAGSLHATHATRVWRFIDDVHLRFTAQASGTRIVGRSQSRIGKGDLGQNARNLRELATALSKAAAPGGVLSRAVGAHDR